MFEFTLTPLDKVGPSGKPPDLRLGWFTLTDGNYHINLGIDRLLEYSFEIQQRHGWPRTADYYIAQLHDDLLDLIPSLRHVPPAEVVRCFETDPRENLIHKLRELSEAMPKDKEDAELWNAIAALEPAGLMGGYIKFSPSIGLSRSAANVLIGWDCRDLAFEGTPVWSATAGRYVLSFDQFLEHVRDFHVRLMSQMSARVDEVSRHWSRREIKIDVPDLRFEHEARKKSLDEALATSAPSVDWQSVIKQISRVSTREGDMSNKWRY